MPKKADMTAEAWEAFQKASGAAQKGDPQLADLAYHFFNLAGGTEAIAGMLLDDYKSAKPGSMGRIRIIEAVLFSVRFVNQQKGMPDLGDMTDADLRRELREVLGADAATADGMANES